ncbi:hypothetical protein AAHC03_017156 [Spirometra sp. Aus1]
MSSKSSIQVQPPIPPPRPLRPDRKPKNTAPNLAQSTAASQKASPSSTTKPADAGSRAPPQQPNGLAATVADVAVVRKGILKKTSKYGDNAAGEAAADSSKGKRKPEESKKTAGAK